MHPTAVDADVGDRCGGAGAGENEGGEERGGLHGADGSGAPERPVELREGLEVRRDGYLAFVTEIELLEGETTRLNVKLTSSPGEH